MNVSVKWTALMIVAAAALSGCAAKAASATVEVKAANMRFSTAEIVVTKGEPVKLVLANEDGVLHDLSIDHIAVKDVAQASGAEHDHGGAKPELHVAAAAGKRAEVRFTPTEAGTYTFYCTVSGHRDAGMQGALIVK